MCKQRDLHSGTEYYPSVVERSKIQTLGYDQLFAY